MEYCFHFHLCVTGIPAVTALIALVILVFDLLTYNRFKGYLRCASIVPILGFLSLPVLELGRGTRQTGRQTDGQTDIS